MWCFLFVNMVSGLIVFFIVMYLGIICEKDIPDGLATTGVFLGVLVWIPYGIYKLIAYLIKKQVLKKEKLQREISDIKYNVMRIGEYDVYNEVVLDIEYQQKLQQCYSLYRNTESYNDINLLHNNRVDKVFISTINYLLEINKQYADYDDEIEDKKQEIIDKLLKFLIKENEIYEKEYLDMKNKDKQIIKNELDKFSNTIDAYMEFEDIGKDN